MRILSKRDYYKESRKLTLGNVLGTWDWRDFLRTDLEGTFGMRDKRPGSSKLFKRHMDRKQVVAYVESILRRGLISEDDVVISHDTSCADENRTLQGEFWLEPGRGLCVVNSRIPGHDNCRVEMQQPNLNYSYGVKAYALLRQYMDAPSFDCAMDLMRNYSESVVEFTCFGNSSVGLLKWNTVFWEVRNY